ncbi:MAG: hypothetical protein U0521_01905 [Anaerolineae bacterium]
MRVIYQAALGTAVLRVHWIKWCLCREADGGISALVNDPVDRAKM